MRSDDEKEEPPIDFCNVKTDFAFAESRYSESLPTASEHREPAVKTDFAFAEPTDTERRSMPLAATTAPAVSPSQPAVSVGVPVSMPVYYQPMMAVAVPMPASYTASTLPVVQSACIEDIVARIHRETGYGLEDLKALHQKGKLQQIPRNEEGQITSVGSILHSEGDDSQCAPCVFWFKNSCGKGINCAYCHFRHEGQKSKRIRPSKKTRDKMKAESSSTASDISDGEARLPGRKVR